MDMHVRYLVLLALIGEAKSFAPSATRQDSTLCLTAKSRKARRQVERSRPKSLYDAIEESEGKDLPKTKAKKAKTAVLDDDEAIPAKDLEESERQARAAEAQRRMDERPDVSTMIVDEETGTEIVAQGKNVMDVVTRKAVKLLGPDYRLAQMFPGVPPDVRAKYRYDWTTVELPEMVERLNEACVVKLEDGSRGIPPHPSVANSGIDFVLANRDLLGSKMKRALGRLTMRSMNQGEIEKGKELQKLWKNFLTLENHISAPFRQMIMDAEGRCGPNFGNLDLMSFCNGPMYDRCANYLVLKGMVAHWEKKVLDAEYVEKTPQTKENYITVLARGDPKRYLPDPPILFTLSECSQVAGMAQKMTQTFVETPELFDDLPPEVRFIEKALSIKGGTALRKFMVDEYCPQEGITPEGLREGLRRLICQLDNMQIDPYGDIVNILEKLHRAMSIGTDDERDPYAAYIANPRMDGPGSFQTYTFNHEKLSRVRFLDSQYEGTGGVDRAPSKGIGGLFSFGQAEPAPQSKPVDTGSFYKVPPARAAGRPHELGWLDALNGDQKDDSLRLGKVPPGRIINEQ